MNEHIIESVKILQDKMNERLKAGESAQDILDAISTLLAANSTSATRTITSIQPPGHRLSHPQSPLPVHVAQPDNASPALVNEEKPILIAHAEHRKTPKHAQEGRAAFARSCFDALLNVTSKKTLYKATLALDTPPSQLQAIQTAFQLAGKLPIANSAKAERMKKYATEIARGEKQFHRCITSWLYVISTHLHDIPAAHRLWISFASPDETSTAESVQHAPPERAQDDTPVMLRDDRHNAEFKRSTRNERLRGETAISLFDALATNGQSSDRAADLLGTSYSAARAIKRAFQLAGKLPDSEHICAKYARLLAAPKKIYYYRQILSWFVIISKYCQDIPVKYKVWAVLAVNHPSD